MKILSRIASNPLFIILIPALVMTFLIYVRFHATVFDFQPSWNDEIFYWHQTASFIAAGFSNGYYVFDEVPARAAFSHYGPHGPMFPALYGTLGRAFGWRQFSGPVLNLILLALATLVFLRSTPVQPRYRLKLALIFLTFWPLLLYLPSNMQESLHAAAAIVFAAIFYRLISRPGSVTTAQFLLYAGFIFLFALMRPTWSLLFIPLFLYRSATFSRRHILLSCVYASLLAAVVYIIFQWLSAPYANTMSELAGAAQNSLPHAISTFFRHFISNVRLFISLRYATTLETVLHYQTIILLLLLVLESSRRLAPNLSPRLDRLRNSDSYTLFHLLNLGIPLAFVLFFYDIASMRDYRVLAPHILISLLLWSAQGKSKPVYFMAATNLLCILPFALMFSNIHGRHFDGSPSLATPWSKLLKFQPSANSWCNTMFTDAPLDEKFLTVPAGIGLSFTFNAKQMKTPIKSQYLLLSPEGYRVLKERIRVQHIMKTEAGDLYRNLDCGCSAEGSR